VFSVEKVDEWLEQCLDVFAAVVAELDEEMKQPQHLQSPTTSTVNNNTSMAIGVSECLCVSVLCPHSKNK